MIWRRKSLWRRVREELPPPALAVVVALIVASILLGLYGGGQ